MEKTKIVVDASIIAKWFLIEKYSDEALKVRNDYIKGLIEIAVPSLLEYEVLNALKYSGAYTTEELKKIGRALNNYNFTTYQLQGELKQHTIQIAEENNVTIYDASYIALAETIKTKLYTADEELIAKFPNTATHIKQYT